MRRAGQDVPASPCIPASEVRMLRAKLILEEALETIAGLGYSVHMLGDPDCLLSLLRRELLAWDEHEPDLVQVVDVVDGCCDLIVVATGTLSACGVADVAVQREVDESNLRKFGEGGYQREDGKWIKPKDWQPPDLERILADQSEGNP